MYSWNRKRVIAELRKTARKLKHSPFAREVRPALYKACRCYFGSFNRAKQIVRLPIFLNGHQINKGAKTLNEDLAYIIGVIEGDGYCRVRKSLKRTSGEIVLKVKDLDFAEEFKKRLKRWSGIQPKSWEKDREFFVNLYSIKAAKIIKGFNLKRLINSNKKVKAEFLRGLYDSEGGVTGTNLDKRRIACRWIHFSNNNTRIIEIVSNLLENFKISHKVKSRIHSGFGSKKLQYEILIFSLENFERFYKNIGFSIRRKKDKLFKVINSYDKYRKKISTQSYCI